MRKANDMGKQHEILHMPHEQIEQIQLEGLKKTVVNVYENVPFYKNLFDEAGFDPYAVQTLADLQKAPFTTKQDLRDNYPYKMFAVPMKDVREIHMSSGTTGIATVGGYTEHDIDIWSVCFARGIEYAVGGEDDICHVCYGYGLVTGGLGAHYGCMKAGCTTIPMSAGNTERQIRILREMGSTILCCTPSYAMHIADTAISMGIDPATGEVLPDGEWGELVITTTDREATPVIRYRTRDITRIIPGECACGRTHRRIDRLHGRTDDMLIIRGVNVFPSQIEDVMKTFPQVSSWYQIELTRQGALDAVTLKVEPEQGFDFDEISAITAVQKQIQDKLKSALSIGIKVKIVEPMSIPRSEGKAKRVIDNRF